ncbi:MAG: hypothetical protein ACT4NY_01975 [Pseudonocardiales bacterium]
MTRHPREPITAEHFPTPALILRTNDPAAQATVREFADAQARAATTVYRVLTAGLRSARGVAGRAEVFAAAFGMAQDWRYRLAVSRPHPDGRYGAAHAHRFGTAITDEDPNLFRIGESERFRDGATWDPTTRTYVGGAATPASETMRHFGNLAAARLARSPGAEVVTNRVRLPDGHVAEGMRLLRGAAARAAALEMVARISARGGDTARIVVDGDLLYAASPPRAHRQLSFHGAMALLADHRGHAAALDVWVGATYLLYQAPQRKRGSDAVNRVFLVAAGACLLGHPPALPHDIDLRAVIGLQDPFVTELRAAQIDASSSPPR